MCRTKFTEKYEHGRSGQAFWNTLTAEEKIEIGNKMIRRKSQEMHKDNAWEGYLNSVQFEKITDEHNDGANNSEDEQRNEEEEKEEDEKFTFDGTYWWAFFEG